MAAPYFERGGITIYHGDCLDVLPHIGRSPNILITDPPYTAAGGSTNGRSSAADSQFFEFWMNAVAEKIRRAMHYETKGFVFADWRTINIIVGAFRSPGERQTAAAWECKQALVWDREGMGMGSPFRNSFEMIAVVTSEIGRFEIPKNIPTVIRHAWPYGTHRWHQSEKPEALVRQLISWADLTFMPTNIVLDPFMGSGTTLRVAKDLGVKAIGIEIEERYCEMAARRLEQEVLEFT